MMEQEYNYMAPDSSQYKVLTDPIKQFITEFYTSIIENRTDETDRLYIYEYPKLTDKFFKSSRWPSVDAISSLVQNDEFFMILYKEMYYRHVYAHLSVGPTLEERFQSYFNYCDFFNMILDADEPVEYQLPDQWLWDIIDEFIYQYQSFSHFRGKLKQRSDADMEILRDNPKIWNIHSVLNVLYCLVDKSNINSQLSVYSKTGNAGIVEVAGQFGCVYLYKMLGFFSLIGLCRLHCQLGDYYQALKTLENININQQELYSNVQTCHITTLYYMGFSYMMMRRYQDAIRTFSNNVIYAQRVKSTIQHRADVVEYVNKQVDQMYNLLSICLTLYPVRVDDSIQSTLQDKFSEKMNKLNRMDIGELEISFMFACPKFLSPVEPDSNGTDNGMYYMSATEQQKEMFINEMCQMEDVPILRSYLRLYTTLPIAKLAYFLNKSEEALHSDLMCFKHKMTNIACLEPSEGGSSTGALQGNLQSSSIVDFYIDDDMIHIGNSRSLSHFADYFIQQIQMFCEMNQDLDRLNVSVPSTGPSTGSWK